MVVRPTHGAGGRLFQAEGLKGLQTRLVEEMRAGEEHATSPPWRSGDAGHHPQLGAAKWGEADGTVPDVSLDDLCPQKETG